MKIQVKIDQRGALACGNIVNGSTHLFDTSEFTPDTKPDDAAILVWLAKRVNERMQLDEPAFVSTDTTEIATKLFDIICEEPAFSAAERKKTVNLPHEIQKSDTWGELNECFSPAFREYARMLETPGCNNVTRAYLGTTDAVEADGHFHTVTVATIGKAGQLLDTLGTENMTVDECCGLLELPWWSATHFHEVPEVTATAVRVRNALTTRMFFLSATFLAMPLTAEQTPELAFYPRLKCEDGTPYGGAPYLPEIIMAAIRERDGEKSEKCVRDHAKKLAEAWRPHARIRVKYLQEGDSLGLKALAARPARLRAAFSNFDEETDRQIRELETSKVKQELRLFVGERWKKEKHTRQKAAKFTLKAHGTFQDAIYTINTTFGEIIGNIGVAKQCVAEPEGVFEHFSFRIIEDYLTSNRPDISPKYYEKKDGFAAILSWEIFGIIPIHITLVCDIESETK